MSPCYSLRPREYEGALQTLMFSVCLHSMSTFENDDALSTFTRLETFSTLSDIQV